MIRSLALALLAAALGCGGSIPSGTLLAIDREGLAAPAGWVAEQPELGALFPPGELVAASEQWQRVGPRWKHCYAAEAALRDGERERFAREAERLGYPVGETTMGEHAAIASGDMTAVQRLPAEGTAGLDAMLAELGETLERTVTVEICVAHASEGGAERARGFADSLGLGEAPGEIQLARYAARADGDDLAEARYRVPASTRMPERPGVAAELDGTELTLTKPL